jgi:6-phosphogluconolactonase
VNVLVLGDPDAVAHRGAVEFQTLARTAIAQRGLFAVALSGGSTPKAMLGLLASQEFARSVEWPSVHFFWSDERCVPPEDPNSNFGMAKGALLGPIRAADANVHRMRGELEPHAGAADYKRHLEAFFGGSDIRFDLIYLGLGSDGHTASLFPGSAALQATDVPCAPNHVPQDATAPWRLTLTYPALNAGRAVVFLVEGAGKADVFAKVVDGPRDVERFPAQGVKPVDGTLTWLVDRAAAAKLKRA